MRVVVVWRSERAPLFAWLPFEKQCGDAVKDKYRNDHKKMISASISPRSNRCRRTKASAAAGRGFTMPRSFLEFIKCSQQHARLPIMLVLRPFPAIFFGIAKANVPMKEPLGSVLTVRAKAGLE